MILIKAVSGLRNARSVMAIRNYVARRSAVVTNTRRRHSSRGGKSSRHVALMHHHAKSVLNTLGARLRMSRYSSGHALRRGMAYRKPYIVGKLSNNIMAQQ